MGAQAVAAVLDAGLGVGKAAAATVSKGIERTVAKHTAESFRICTGVARKILAIPVLKKVIGHSVSPVY